MTAEHLRVDAETALLAADRRELAREALRLSGFWRRIGLLAAAAPLLALIVVLLDVPDAAEPAPDPTVGRLVALTLVIWAAIGLVGVGRLLLLPPLRNVPAAAVGGRTHWQVSARRILTEHPDGRYDLDWHDVDRVVITRRLFVVELGERRGVLGLPRRDITGYQQALIAGWAEDSGAELRRRRGGRRPSGDDAPCRAGSG